MFIVNKLYTCSGIRDEIERLITMLWDSKSHM